MAQGLLMQFTCYTDWQQLPAAANTLFEQAARQSIFFSRPWLENLSCELEKDQSLLLACVTSGDSLLAMLPLVKYEGKTWYPLKHRYTTHFSVLLADPQHHDVLACLAEGLSRLPFAGLLLEPVASDDPGINALQAAMTSAGFHTEYLFRFYNWVHPVEGLSFLQYLATRPARLRSTLERKKRKLQREHGYEIRLFTGEEVPRAMADYHAVYRASWKAYEQYEDFLSGIVAGFSRPGWSRLAVLYVAGQPVAAQLWFVHAGKASIFRLAYDEAWKAFSPGTILTAYLMEYVIDTDRVKEIDFLTGNETYKQDWMSERRERFALSCIKHRESTGIFQRLARFIQHRLKTWAKNR